MHTILVTNPKGGAGKTTLATNLAAWLAGRRQKVGLQDLDRQQSATQWLKRRPELFPTITRVTRDEDRNALRGLELDWLVVDSPAGLHGEELRDAVRRADLLLVPVAPSAFDIDVTRDFLALIAEYKAVRKGELPVGLVGNRIDARTLSAQELEEFLAASGFPLVAHLRDAQAYVHCARDGISVFELPRSRAEQDWDQWRPLTRWISRQLKH
ncbi:MAG: ParA family protein [Betaproteobacteria bacterium]|nr:ParA family protein [Betaproteobacteria bacterium]